MREGDNAFFEAYTSVDKICGEIYNCTNGTSVYIEQMEQLSAEGEKNVLSWADDLSGLKRARWVRNQLAHQTFLYQLSEEKDLRFIRKFYTRLLNGTDPLASLNRNMTEIEVLRGRPAERRETSAAEVPVSIPVSKPFEPASVTKQFEPVPEEPARPQKKKRSWGALLFEILAAAVLLLFVLYWLI